MRRENEDRPTNKHTDRHTVCLQTVAVCIDINRRTNKSDQNMIRKIILSYRVSMYVNYKKKEEGKIAKRVDHTLDEKEKRRHTNTHAVFLQTVAVCI